MKPSAFLRRVLCTLLSLSVLLSLCGCAQQEPEDTASQFSVVTTTYPLYVLTSAVSAGVDHLEISRLSTGQVSCLHDYTLTISDMRNLEQADLLFLNGADLESFLDEVLGQLSALQIDCSASIDLLEVNDHEHHSHGDDGHEDHEHDPHYWMDPRNLSLAAQTIAQALSQADPGHAAQYQSNADVVTEALQDAYTRWSASLSGLSFPYLITFHDGFHYFAEAFGLELLFAMEEEDGATASAKDITAAAILVKEYSLPSIFVEVNGSSSAAQAVSGETGTQIAALSMLMSGSDAPAEKSATEILEQSYLAPMEENIKTLAEVLK